MKNETIALVSGQVEMDLVSWTDMLRTVNPWGCNRPEGICGEASRRTDVFACRVAVKVFPHALGPCGRTAPAARRPRASWSSANLGRYDGAA